MSNLGFHSLFHRTSAFGGLRTVRFFIERGKELFSPEASIPAKKSLFRASPPTLRSFNIILFTVAFELDYVNIVRMLELSSIPPLSNERDERYPLIISGGIAPSANPRVLSVFSDFVCVGDMDDLLERILEILFRCNFRKSENTLKEIEGFEGIYRMDGRTPKRWVKEDITVPAHSAVLTRKTEFSDKFLIEIVRGCRHNCTFCMTRCVTRPVRFVKSELITRTVKSVIAYTRKVGLIAPVLTDHPEIVEIVKKMNSLGFVASFSSLRADDFSEELARLLKANGQKTVTFAPETGSFILRKQIGKDLADEDLYRAVALAAANGVKRFRYYFMYGLPGETTDDVRNIVLISKKTMNLIFKMGCTLHLSINPFIPKKGTALEGESVYPLEYYREMQKLLEKELSGIPGISVKFESLRFLHIQHQLSIGNLDTGYLLNDCILKGSMRPFQELGIGGY
ncbi:MAG: radical SAM protein [Spirochaetota bacterium]|nr:MAG: radical SAM protein [Spirochaetota bacterium]